MLHPHTTGALRTNLFRQRLAMSLAVVVGLQLAGHAAVADEDVAALVKQARDNFRPISDEQLVEARANVVQQADNLQRFLVPGSTNGKNWNRYLKWEALEEQLSSEEPMDRGPLAATYRRLNADHNGLELAPFRRLSEALRRYVHLAAAVESDNFEQVYDDHLDALAEELDQYAEEPSHRLARSINRRLELLAELGQSPDLIGAIRREYAQPNAFVNVSADLLNEAAAADPIDRTDPVTDVILGTRIRGTSYTTGEVSVRPVPSDEHAVLELTSVGHSESRNRGVNGPAVIRSTGHTDFTATTLVELSDERFRARTAQVDARTRSDIHSVNKQGGGFGSRIVSRVGWTKAQEKHARADSIASAHAEDRIRRRTNDEVSDKLRSARDRYEEQYRDPLARRGELPEQISFRTTDDDLRLIVTQASGSQLAAPDAPPSPPEGQDLVMRLHQSAVNNYATAVMGGVTARETEPGQDTEFSAPLPDWLKDIVENRDKQAPNKEPESDEFEPWSLTFGRSQAISVAFVGNQVELTIHMARLTSGDDNFANWDVTGTFTPELTEGGVVLHREGDLVVLPTGFDPEHDQLSSRQVALRSNLTKVLNERSAQGRGFPDSITIDALEPTDEWAEIGPLSASQFTSEGGWLTLVWNRQ